MIYDVSVECTPGCHLDEIALITGDAGPLLELAHVDPQSWNDKPGQTLVGGIQGSLATIVDKVEEFRTIELADLENGVDIVVGFLVVIRDAILAHSNRGIPTVVAVRSVGA